LQLGAPGPQSPSLAHSHLPRTVLQVLPPRAGVHDVLDVHGFWHAPRAASHREGLPQTSTRSSEPYFLTVNVLNVVVFRKDVQFIVLVAKNAQEPVPSMSMHTSPKGAKPPSLTQSASSVHFLAVHKLLVAMQIVSSMQVEQWCVAG
jgi:hypothetical protein